MKRVIVLLSALVICTVQLAAQQMIPIPADPAVRTGRLENGMTYYIRHNAKPEKQAEFYILHNVGAMQEDTTQIGLAHFLEHMAFNGTENFPDKALIGYLEKIGVKFGQNLNAGTGQELTVYNMSNVPLLRESVTDSCLLILHDWSHYISLLPGEIEKERGVIIEELRTGRDADARVGEVLDPYLYNGSKYAYRNVIGTEAGLRSFKPQVLADFYHKWYRTDQQVIVVVGDFDVDRMEQKIIAVMSPIPAVEHPAPRIDVEIPDNEQPLIGIATDPELSSTMVSLYIKHAPIPHELKSMMPIAQVNTMMQMIGAMASQRFEDMSQKPGAPFMGAGFSADYPLTQTCDATLARAMAREGEAARSFEAIYTEIERIHRYGFTPGELERVQSNMMRGARQSYDNRNDRRNGDFVWIYLSNYRDNTPMPEAELEWKLDSTIIANANLSMINLVAQQLITRNNQVVTISAPAKEGVAVPSQQDILAIMARVHDAQIEPIADDVVREPLVTVPLKGSKVTKTATDRFGATVWTLGNGIKVVLKPTDFKADELLMSVNARGGMSLLTDADYPSGEMLATLVSMSGVGKFSATELTKQLAGKAANVSLSLQNYENGFGGSCSPKDLETMLQLLYLYFTQPRFTQQDFDVMMDKYSSGLANASNNPAYRMQIRMSKDFYGDNFRRQIVTPERLKLANFQSMERIYRQLFSNGANFTFSFAGSIDPAQARELIEKYIGSLPTSKKLQTWQDDKVRIVTGEVTDRFAVPMQVPKSTALTVFSGELPYTQSNMLTASILKQILDIRYQESVREEKGGTYGVGTDLSLTQMPREGYSLAVQFDTGPAMVDELLPIIIAELQQIAQEGPLAEDLGKVKEYMVKQRQENSKRNGAWLNYIDTFYVNGLDLNTDYDTTLAGIDAAKIKALAAKILADGNVLKLIMEPQQ